MAKQSKNVTKKYGALPRLTSFFFNKPRFTALIWLTVTVFGLLSYTTFLKREGFPSVNIPLAVVSGTYFVNDPAKVDSDLAAPLSEIARNQPGVSAVTTSSADNFFTVSIQYKEGTDAKQAAQQLEQKVKESAKLPTEAQLTYNVPYFGATGGDIQPIDVAVSFYADNDATSTLDLTTKAKEAAEYLKAKQLSLVSSIAVKDPYAEITDPSSGRAITIQRNFDRYGVKEGDTSTFRKSVLIAIAKVPNADVLKLDHEVHDALQQMTTDPAFSGYKADISASFAPSIKDNIGELQRVLLEGLLAVLVVGSIVIAIRASIITVLSMVTVLLLSLGLLFVIGYTLNVITLFALILSLALIVDDTIIMVEAIDAARRGAKDRVVVVKEATSKISRAMVAATLTAALSFAPLLFVGGILGDFIKAIPVTIIAALLISLLVALVFIPFLSRFFLLSPKQMGKEVPEEGAARFEARLAEFVTRPMLWGRKSGRKLFGVWLIAVLVGSGFIFGGLFIARNVVFNIFPPSKDTNAIVVNLSFPQGTSIKDAETIADNADALVEKVVGNNFVKSSYYDTGSSNAATLQIELTPYGKRELHSPEIVAALQSSFDKDFSEAHAVVAQSDIGPPASAFTVQLTANNRSAAFATANELATYLRGVELKRINGKIARVTNVTISSESTFERTGDRPIVTVTGNFDGNDTSTLVNLAQDAVKKTFTGEKLAQTGLKDGDVTFDLGQESENQDSFNTLLLAFPILLIVVYILLAFQFRSLLQPLLIFLAIPFSLFGIMLGLDLTHNAISFFTMLGFFALVGLSIKNTILLTDYANQARRSGASSIDAAVEALQERFRPLFATSMTAVVSLIPLAISSPFWEGLAVVLICGLLSSTFLVITVFPYYFLGAEYLRGRFSRTQTLIWLGALIGGCILLSVIDQKSYIGLWVLVVILFVPVHKLLLRFMRPA
jgi:multidrug efflux pump subunit AcrB